MIKPNMELSISRQCELLSVSRSSLYYRPKPDLEEGLELLKRLDEIFTENPMYGSRRIQVVLRCEGIRVGRRRIRSRMCKLGLWAVTPRPDTIRHSGPRCGMDPLSGLADLLPPRSHTGRQLHSGSCRWRYAAWNPYSALMRI